ncbi:MAG: hypothetical protein ABIQ31_04640 [Ferruginibacter sp.]
MPTNNTTGNTEVDNVRVRMYCHGFGDCFLLTYCNDNTPAYRMLIDCGMLTGKPDLMKEAIMNIKKDCNDHLDLVVQTHEHKDHVSGFNIKDSGKLLWDTIQVDNVWLAWTENIGPAGDGLANQLKEKQNKKTKALANAIGLYKKATNSQEHRTMLMNEYRGGEYLAAQDRYTGALEQLLTFYDIEIDKEFQPVNGDERQALNSDNKRLTIGEAMNYFIGRKGNNTLIPEKRPGVNFWNPGEIAGENETGLKGINFYFLGPPKDYNKLRVMEDNAHVEMYITDMGLSENFYLALDTDENDGQKLSPFHSRYILKTENKLSALKFKEEDEDHVWNLYHSKDNGWRTIEIDWLHNTGALALHLDSYTNNTSLAFAIEFEKSGKVLLFPADAQIGNWLSWTETATDDKELKLKWPVNKNGIKEIVTVEQLLNRTVFYKVGHHGSDNATAKKHGLELMTSEDLVAMIPVDEEVAKKQGKKGWKMPAEDLYKRLQEKTKGRIIRLDKGNILDHPEELFQAANPTKKQIDIFKGQITTSETQIEYDTDKKRPLYYEYRIDG